MDTTFTTTIHFCQRVYMSMVVLQRTMRLEALKVAADIALEKTAAHLSKVMFIANILLEHGVAVADGTTHSAAMVG
jgi:hypothetical protein